MAISCGSIPSRGLREIQWGGHKRASRHLALVTCIDDFLLRPDCEGRLWEKAPRPSASLPCLLYLFHGGTFFFFVIPFPSRKPLAFIPSNPPPVSCFPRDPTPPHTPSHPRTVTNDRITNPRSTDMFTRTTYALTKSKWERDQGIKRLQSILEDSVQP